MFSLQNCSIGEITVNQIRRIKKYCFMCFLVQVLVLFVWGRQWACVCVSVRARVLRRVREAGIRAGVIGGGALTEPLVPSN